MVDLVAIEQEIDRLEGTEDTTYETCNKLAVLYSIVDHTKRHNRAGYSKEVSSDSSEFLRAVANADINYVLDIMDEHMCCIQLLHPREYSAIIKKIQE